MPDVEQFLSGHEVKVTPGDHKELHLTGPHGLELRVGLGDHLKFVGDSLGIERAAEGSIEQREIIWKGDNAAEVLAFVKDWDTDISVIGNQLKLIWDEECSVLDRGDKVLQRGRYLFVSKAGQDHRN